MMTRRLLLFAAVLAGAVQCTPTTDQEAQFKANLYNISVREVPVPDPSPLIIGGGVSTYGDHPYTCSFQRRRNGEWRAICAAVIYDRNNLLTVAHCLTPNPETAEFRAICGEFDLTMKDELEVIKTIVDFRIHPGYRDSAFYPNDIAILKVESPLVFNAFVNKVHIPRRRLWLIPTECQLVGWGITETGRRSTLLKEVTSSRLKNRECIARVGPIIRSTNVCFFDEIDGGTACFGDSGGSAVCGGYLIGLTSFGESACTGRFPVMYTRVTKYLTWIKRNRFRGH